VPADSVPSFLQRTGEAEACGRNRDSPRIGFEKDMDDFANEQLGLTGYATSMVTRGTFQGEDAMEDKRLAAKGPNPSGRCMCGCGRKTKIVTKSDRRHGHL
jgi:hypothetical protein